MEGVASLPKYLTVLLDMKQACYSTRINKFIAQMVELVVTGDSKSPAERRVGSSPTPCTKNYRNSLVVSNEIGQGNRK